MKLKKFYSEIFSETTGIEIQSQHWGGNRKLSMISKYDLVSGINSHLFYPILFTA